MSILEEEDPNDMLFQQEEAHPHLHQEVIDFLNGKFSKKLNGKGRPITMPLCSP
jgi:hypothetical protein